MQEWIKLYRKINLTIDGKENLYVVTKIVEGPETINGFEMKAIQRKRGLPENIFIQVPRKCTQFSNH